MNIQPLLIRLVTILLLISIAPELIAANHHARVLMVVSSNGEAQGETAPGFEFDEFAKAYLVFKQHGIEVDVASPKGGNVEADKYDPTTPYNKKVLGDKHVMAKLNNTLATATINANDYQAVFVVGGKGAMFDLPKDEALQQLIADIYQQRGAVAAVCHGPAALVNVELSNGDYLVDGKAVNGFTNLEEKLFGKKWMKDFDFMLEDKLVARGGRFQSSDIMLSHVAVDNGLITGQNPASTVPVAMELVKAMGIEPLQMAQYADDKTFSLIARIIEGDESAIQAAKTLDGYKLDLVAMYGYYYQHTGNDEQALSLALTLMQLGQQAINNPRLDVAIAKVQHKLGDQDAALQSVNNVLANTPEYQPALDLLAQLRLQ